MRKVKFIVDNPSQNYDIKKGDEGEYVEAVAGGDGVPCAVIIVNNQYRLVSFGLFKSLIKE